MPPFNMTKIIPSGWPAWAQVVAIVVLCLVIALAVLGVLAIPAMIRGCGAEPDTVATAKAELLEQVQAELAAGRERAAAIDAELVALQLEVQTLRDELAASVAEREEAHGAIDTAPTIGDIDAVLKRGIAGASGRVSGRDR